MKTIVDVMALFLDYDKPKARIEAMFILHFYYGYLIATLIDSLPGLNILVSE